MLRWVGREDTLEPLSGLDAAFLYMETPNAPMHLGGLSVLEGSLAFETFRAHLLERMHLMPSLRKRLVTVPLSIDRPYWVTDPDFNIDWHLHHTALPKPGGWKQLRKLAARIFSQPLDQSRPLWEFVFVEGLNEIPQVPPGSVAVISKVHHAAIDGVSGADLLGLLFDVTAESETPEPPAHEKVPDVPSDLEMLALSAYNFATRPLKLPSILFETAKATATAGYLSRAAKMPLPTVPFTAPSTVLNQPISSERIWNTALLSLDRIKALKRVMGFTVNDVILTICSGALRRYLLDRNALPKDPLVAMVPVSMRSEGETGGGNKVTAMFIQLATDVEDPIERFKKVRENAIQGKSYQKAVNAQALVDYSEFVPFGLAGQAARLYSRSQLSSRHRPAVNCVITNVPGPQIPLYLAGHRLLAHMGMAPVLDGMGLMIPVLSYDGVVSISAYSSPQIMPDLDLFTRYLRESANELEAAVLALEEAQEVLEERQATEDVKQVFEHYQTHLESHPDMKIRGQGIYQIDITGRQAQQWVFAFTADQRTIYEGTHEDALCTMQVAEQDFVAMAKGELDAMAAFMQGKLKIHGNVNEAINLGRILATFPPPNG